ncbi:MAG: hypothetical protein PHV28_02980 [Kiritimatiellae bacterium]|nr:hypothetical protein [Kiritimatiellia bacterium]
MLQLLNGARLRIGAGGSVLHNHDDPTVYTYAEGTSSKIRISAGTELSLESGGSFKATNFVGRLIVEGAEGNPARIKVDSGNFSFHTASSVNPRMILGPYSELLVTNTGLFHIDSTKDGSKYPPFYQAGGMIDVSGDSTFTVGRTKARPFGTGTTTFRGNALLTVDEGLFDQKYYPDIYIGPSCNCETSTVVFTDHAKFYTAKFSSLTRFRVGDDSPLAEENAITNGLAVLRYDSDSYSRFGSYFTVGSDYCRGELYLNSGSMSVTYGSLEVGGGNYEYRRDRSDAHGEGLMAVNGGTFDVRALNGHVDSIIQGLIVGAGWESKLDGNSFYRGRLELNSGIVRSNTDAANVIVGAGRAKGEIVQNGGTFEHKRAERNFAMAIGFSGGDGSYVITGGTATVKSDLYVGGVLPSTFNYTLDYCPNNHDAVGLLSVRGGTFSVVSNLVLSADGAGTLEIGGAGLLTVGGDLVLSNCTETASVATLKYTFGASGVGSLSVGGDIVVASGSKLVVDMSEYTGPLKTFQLLDLSSAEGTFSDIEFVKPSVEGGNRLTLDVDADGIRVRTNHKTLIMIY